MSSDATYERFASRYAAGDVPWDNELPPPEVIDLVATLPPGRGLDIGCGYGRSAIYLAQQGWRADGVDFVATAVSEARRRAAAAGVTDNVQFWHGSVSGMPFLTDAYDLAIDVGCLHALTEPAQQGYRDELLRLLKPGATYLVFARTATREATSEDGPRGIAETAVLDLFSPHFTLEKLERGETAVEDKPAWTSAWFWWRKQ